jgi:hypothetical protein
MRGKQRVYYCKCGRVAVRETGGAKFLALGDGASQSELGRVRIEQAVIRVESIVVNWSRHRTAIDVF